MKYLFSIYEEIFEKLLETPTREIFKDFFLRFFEKRVLKKGIPKESLLDFFRYRNFFKNFRKNPWIDFSKNAKQLLNEFMQHFIKKKYMIFLKKSSSKISEEIPRGIPKAISKKNLNETLEDFLFARNP